MKLYHRIRTMNVAKLLSPITLEESWYIFWFGVDTLNTFHRRSLARAQNKDYYADDAVGQIRH